jgi:PIN domain nuclease of toxin-antitoxin system
MLYVVDTHALLWFLRNDARLGIKADLILQDPSSDLILPAIVLAETAWLIERKRVAFKWNDFLNVLDGDGRFSIYPLDRAVIERSYSLYQVGEMHDRQIVATALVLQDMGESIAILTKDQNITESGLVPIIW